MTAIATPENEPQSRPAAARRVPTVVVAALSVLILALLVIGAIQVSLAIKHRQLFGSGSGLAQLTAQQQRAVDAAKQETINIQTFRRKSFASDFQAALNGMTQAQGVQFQARKADLQSTLTKIKADTGATVSGAGLVSFTGTGAVVLVAADAQRTDSKGVLQTTSLNRFQLTMKLVNGTWLMDDLQSVALS